MTSRDFCYWMQGLFEIGRPAALDAGQVDLIRRHLAMVFVHEIDPSFGGPEQQEKLEKLHKAPSPEAMKELIKKLEQVTVTPSDITYRC